MGRLTAAAGANQAEDLKRSGEQMRGKADSVQRALPPSSSNEDFMDRDDGPPVDKRRRKGDASPAEASTEVGYRDGIRGAFHWQELGFDLAVLQPNYMLGNKTMSHWEDVANSTQTFGLGVEMELGFGTTNAYCDRVSAATVCHAVVV